MFLIAIAIALTSLSFVDDTTSKLSEERPLGYRKDTSFDLTDTDDLKGIRADMAIAIQAYIDANPNAGTANPLDKQFMQLWFYDCSSGAVAVCYSPKKIVVILVQPRCGIDECNLVLIDREDLYKLSLDAEILLSVHRTLSNKLPQSRLSLKATEVVSYEDLCKLTGKTHVQLKD